MQNYLNFADIDGVNFGVTNLSKNESCIVCSRQPVTFETSPITTLKQFIKEVKER